VANQGFKDGNRTQLRWVLRSRGKQGLLSLRAPGTRVRLEDWGRARTYAWIKDVHKRQDWIDAFQLFQGNGKFFPERSTGWYVGRGS
jgi:hypothetical protein